MTRRGAVNVAIIVCIVALVPIIAFVNWAVMMAADVLAEMGAGK